MTTPARPGRIVRGRAGARLAALALLAASAVASAASDVPALTDADCGPLANAYGPYDYINPGHVRDKLPIVEEFHFTPDIENLVRGYTVELPGGDLDYTLRAFPNHHRALYAMVKYQLRYSKMRVPPGAQYPAECYLMRAARFNPRDANVQVLYGLYLDKVGRTEEAIERYEAAIALNPYSAEAHYNLGLLYLKRDELDASVEHAKSAYELGYPLMGLKKNLMSRGAWPDESDG